MTGQQGVVVRIGVPGEGAWLGTDGVWNFEDETSYCASPDNGDKTPLPLNGASRPR